MKLAPFEDWFRISTNFQCVPNLNYASRLIVRQRKRVWTTVVRYREFSYYHAHITVITGLDFAVLTSRNAFLFGRFRAALTAVAFLATVYLLVSHL